MCRRSASCSVAHAGSARPAKSRGPWMGVAGLATSLLGLLSCGVLSPIGLIISVLGLRGSHRGFAVVGTVISAIGTLFLAGGITAAVVGEQAARERHQNALLSRDALKQVETLAAAIESHRDVVGAIPLSLSELSTLPPDAFVDPWGSEYRYLPNLEKQTFSIVSRGPDMIPETDDDVSRTACPCESSR